MKLKEIIRQVQDPKLYFEIIEKDSGASHGFYIKNELYYNDNLNKRTVDKINANYINNKRILEITIK